MKHRGCSWNPVCVFTVIQDIHIKSNLSLKIKQPEHEDYYFHLILRTRMHGALPPRLTCSDLCSTENDCTVISIEVYVVFLRPSRQILAEAMTTSTSFSVQKPF
jgi:hypothetical protein